MTSKPVCVSMYAFAEMLMLIQIFTKHVELRFIFVVRKQNWSTIHIYTYLLFLSKIVQIKIVEKISIQNIFVNPLRPIEKERDKKQKWFVF